jgi:folate-binding protein YgfZ
MTHSSEFLVQHAALTSGTGLADLSGRTQLEIRGSDRVQLLNNFSTNDIKRLLPGHGCEAFITSPQGKTLSHVLVFCEPDRLLLDTSPGQAAMLIAHFDKYVISEDVQFVDRTQVQGEMLVAGAQSLRVLAELIGAELPVEMLASAKARVAGREVAIRRVEYAGPASVFVQTAPEDLNAVRDALLGLGAVNCGNEAVEAARLEAGFPLFGRDITEDNLPQEVGRDARAISFTKGCYLGQETVARIDALGHVNRSLVGLKFDSMEVPAAGTAVLSANKAAGQVTSSAWSGILNAPLAMAYVRRNQAAVGSRLSSAIGGAEVVALPVTARP